MTNTSKAFHVAVVISLLAAFTLLVAPSAEAKKRSPTLTDTSFTYNCATGDSTHGYAWVDLPRAGNYVVHLTWLVDWPDGRHEEIDNWYMISADERPGGSVEEVGIWPSLPNHIAMQVTLAKGKFSTSKPIGTTRSENVDCAL